MKTSMLEYIKMILLKVSFNRYLLVREYRKSLSWLSRDERRDLKSWLKNERLL